MPEGPRQGGGCGAGERRPAPMVASVRSPTMTEPLRAVRPRARAAEPPRAPARSMGWPPAASRSRSGEASFRSGRPRCRHGCRTCPRPGTDPGRAAPPTRPSSPGWIRRAPRACPARPATTGGAWSGNEASRPGSGSSAAGLRVNGLRTTTAGRFRSARSCPDDPRISRVDGAMSPTPWPANG